MRTFTHFNFKGQVIWVAALLAVFMFSHGVVSAQVQSKDQQKCINNLNKNAGKMMKAVGGDYSTCLKAVAKDDPTTSMEACILDDQKGKRAKAQAGLDDKAGGACDGGANQPDFGYTPPGAAGQASIDKELRLLRAVFGSDLDSVIVTKEADKDGSKCQQAVWKAVQKCQDTKIKLFGACKKNELKGKNPTETPITSAQELQDACLGRDTGSIPDPKGKLPGKCLGGIQKAVDKKCIGLDLGTYFPGAGGGSVANLERKVECEVCKALNEIDGLNRACDLFDDGVVNESCEFSYNPFIQASCDFDEELFCEGGDRDGLPCEDWVNSSDCPPKPGPAACEHTEHTSLAYLLGDYPINDITLNGSFEMTCGPIDAATGTGTCTCRLLENILILIPSITAACLIPGTHDCGSGSIDCQGGTPLDVDIISDHDIGEFVLALDPNNPFQVESCGLNLIGTAEGPAECAAACDGYCASLGENYTQLESGCEGYCRGGIHDGETCDYPADCNGPGHPGNTSEDGFCVGTSVPSSGLPHYNTCNCSCVDMNAGGASRPGSFNCQIPIRTIQEDDAPCGAGEDVQIVQGNQCLPFTTEKNVATILNVGLDPNANPDIVQSATGSPKTCTELRAGDLRSLTMIGNVPAFDGGPGDNGTMEIQKCEH
jgi:hypothetical protein